MKVGLVGLGIMGSAYAAHLIEAGYATGGFDVDPAALERFRALGGTPAASAAELAARSETVISALPSVASFEAAYFGPDGIAAGAAPGTIALEMSTLPLDVKERARDRLAAGEVTLLDAPVSGAGSQARVKDLAVYASGDATAFEEIRPVLAAFARRVVYVGPFGIGSKLKYVANLLVTIHNLSTAEALVLGERAGIPTGLLFDVLSDSAGASRMLTVRGPSMLADAYDEPSMKLEVYKKDLEIIAAFARSLDVPTPLFSASLAYYDAALADGRGAQDTAAIAAVLKRMAGLPVGPRRSQPRNARRG